MTTEESWQNVASLTEVEENTRLIKSVDGNEISIFRSNGEIHACLNRCPHIDGPLGEGAVTEISCENESKYPNSNSGDKLITCPWHGWKFDLSDGKNAYTDDYKIPIFDVKVEDSEIYIK